LEYNTRVNCNFGFRKKFQIGLFASKEIKEDLGFHSEIFGATPFLPFTTIQARYSVSEKRMAKYIYGPSGSSGSGFASLGINGVFSMNVFWNAY